MRLEASVHHLATSCTALLAGAVLLLPSPARSMPREEVLTVVAGDEVQLSGGEEVCFTFDDTDYRELQVKVRIRFSSYVPRGHLLLDELRGADFREPSEEFSFWVNPKGLHRLRLALEESATSDTLQLATRGVGLEHASCEGYEDDQRARMAPLEPPRPESVNRLSSGTDPRDPPHERESLNTAQDAQVGSTTLPSGTELRLTLEDELSSGRSYVGQTFRTRLNEDLVREGVVVLPAGSEITGHVTQAQNAGRFGTSKLGLGIDSVRLDSGKTIPLRASLLRVGPGSGKKQGKIIAGSALGGALLGQLLGGDTEATVLGAALGAGIAAGTIASKPGEPITLPPGTTLQVSLDEATTVPERSVHGTGNGR